MHYLNYISIAALAFIFYKLITDKSGSPAGARHIEPCRVCGAPGQLKEDFLDSHVQCSNIYCAMAGPLGCCEVEAISAWNNLPSMSAIVAWQFQAAGLALALQRQIEMGEALRNAQWMASVDRRFVPSANEVGEEFDAALVIASKALEVRHG